MDYPWERFWLPPGTTLPADEDYLVDPTTEFRSLFQEPVRTLADLRDKACLVLLGEAGSGKTREVQKEVARLEKEQQDGELEVMCFDLGMFGGGDHLQRLVFGNPCFHFWSKSKGRLFLFLDGLDEGMLSMDGIGKLLLGELKRLEPEQRERLHFRLTCRTAEWLQRMGFLQTGLAELWGPGKVEVLELAPLRRRDVETAAQEQGHQPKTFLAAVGKADVDALAARPITLEFLLGMFGEDQDLAGNRASLYRAGVMHLCRDSEERVMRSKSSLLDSAQRLTVAARAAAVMMLANRTAIHLGQDRSTYPPEYISLQDLVGEGESVAGGVPLLVSTAEIREVINNTNNLFVSSPGQNGVKWSHRSYAEYLAAWHLADQGVSPGRVLQLLSHPQDKQGRLVPQLYGLAGWICSLQPEVAEQVIDKQPEVLLLGDPSQLSSLLKKRLVGSLLDAFDRRELHDLHGWVNRSYEALNHGGLAEQLRPFLANAEHGEVARIAAVEMALQCHRGELVEELLALALNRKISSRVRRCAVRAVGKLGTTDHHSRLLPLARGDAGEDPDDELKGNALRVLWPDQLQTTELFELLSAPKRPNFLGAYWLFLLTDLLPHLESKNLPSALSWIVDEDRYHHLDSFAEKLLGKAWENLEHPGVVEPMVQALVCLEQRHSVLSERLDKMAEDGPPLRCLVSALVEYESGNLSDVARRSSQRLVFRLANGLDFSWLLEQFLTKQASKKGHLWVELIVDRFMSIIGCLIKDSISDEEQLRLVRLVQQLMVVAQDNPTLAQSIAPFLQVELDSPHARWQRKQITKKGKEDAAAAARAEKLGKALDQARKVLDDPDTPPAEAWSTAFWLMESYPNGRTHTWILPGDLVQRPLWIEAAQEIKDKLIQAANAYLLREDPQLSPWFASNYVPGEAALGAHALFLLATAAPQQLESLSDDIWAKWSPVLLTWPDMGEAEQVRETLLVRAYRAAPQSLNEALLRRLSYEEQQDHSLVVLYKVEPLLVADDTRDRLGEILLEYVAGTPIKPPSEIDILSALLRHGHEPAKHKARQWILTPPRSSLARSSVTAMLLQATSPSWDTLKPFFEEFPEQGKEIALEVAHKSDRARYLPGTDLNDMDLASLYVWLVKQFPHAEDPIPGKRGMQPVTRLSELARWRDSLLSVLKERGTCSSYEAITHIAQKLRHLDWLSWVVREADEVLRQKSWVRWEPAEVLSLIQDANRPLLRTEGELLESVLESLKRYQVLLQQGITPRAERLWSDRPYRPKLESFLSDEVAIFLRQDLGIWGVVVSREEETRPSTGQRTGERNDLVVRKAVSQPDGSSIEMRCVVEVKRCCNKGVKTSMSTQLVDRYLAKGASSVGIYLVVWFDRQSWSEVDKSNRNRVPFSSIEEAQAYLEVQANELSTDNQRVVAFVLDASLRPK